jgi:hypothetical protein
MLTMRPVARRLRRTAQAGRQSPLGVLRVGGLAALLWAVSNEHAADGAPRVPMLLLVVTAVGWIGWLASRRGVADARVTGFFLVVLAGAGGVVAGLAPVGIAFPAVAVLAAAAVFSTVPIVLLAIIGAAAVTVTVLVNGTPHAVIAEGNQPPAVSGSRGAGRRTAGRTRPRRRRT